jgi:thiol-disulfide isomerase/thioredoxin
MRRLFHALQVIVALGFAGLMVYLWGAMIVNGDDAWFSWRRSFNVAGLYVDMYALLLCTAVSLPAVVFGLWRVGNIAGWLPDREGPRWTSNTLLAMALAGMLVVTVRYQLWEDLAGKPGGSKPAPPSDDKLEFPALPLAAEVPFAWEIEDLSGAKLDFTTLKGKTVFLNIWATWCGFCILEFPNIQRLYEKFKDDPAVVFLIVSDEEPEKVRAWMETEGKDFKLPFYISRAKFPGRFDPRGYPTTYIVAPDGRTAFEHSGFVAWDGEKTTNFLKQLAHGPTP